MAERRIARRISYNGITARTEPRLNKLQENQNMSSNKKQESTSGAFSVGSSTLLDCPFCGGTEKTVEKRNWFGSDNINYFVHCVSCGADGGWSKNKGNAEKLWNTRSSDREYVLEEALKLYAPNHELLKG